MTALIVGLIVFLGVHSIGILAPNFRAAMLRRLGEASWKGIYSLIALAGLVLLIWGYGETREAPTLVWLPPTWTAHVAGAFMLPAFILLVAAYVPGTYIKARIGHPMVLAVKVWALAHLFSNGTANDLLLFGGFLIWSVVYFAVARSRDRIQGTTYPAISVYRDLIAVAGGIVVWLLFALVAHEWLIGVTPFVSQPPAI